MTTHKTLRGPRGGLITTTKAHIKKINSSIFPGGQGGPLMHVIAAKAIALREAMSPDFVTYQKQVVENAGALAETLTERGVRIVSGGTENHVMLVDVSSIGLSGAQGEELLHAVDITANKNLIPYDSRPPMEASGVRLGTAAVTTRGLGKAESIELGNCIADVLLAPGDESVAKDVQGRVTELAKRFPIYGAH